MPKPDFKGDKMVGLIKMNGVYAITFSDSDKEKMIKLFDRALNTWHPVPPQDLLDTHEDLKNGDSPTATAG